MTWDPSTPFGASAHAHAVPRRGGGPARQERQPPHTVTVTLDTFSVKRYTSRHMTRRSSDGNRPDLATRAHPRAREVLLAAQAPGASAAQSRSWDRWSANWWGRRKKGLVQQTGWLTEREFLVAVAMGMISPGPVVITATFVGYLVAGFWGSVVATIGIFLPSFLLVLIVAPILVRYRSNQNVQGFIRGAYAAAIGTILGACVLLARIAIGDWLTALVALGSLVMLFRWKVSNPVLVAVTAIIGLIVFPLLNPAWVFVK